MEIVVARACPHESSQNMALIRAVISGFAPLSSKVSVWAVTSAGSGTTGAPSSRARFVIFSTEPM